MAEDADRRALRLSAGLAIHENRVAACRRETRSVRSENSHAAQRIRLEQDVGTGVGPTELRGSEQSEILTHELKLRYGEPVLPSGTGNGDLLPLCESAGHRGVHPHHVRRRFDVLEHASPINRLGLTIS